MKTLQEDLQEILKKHGLKADDANKQSESEEPTGKASEVVTELSASIAKKLAEAVKENKGLSDTDTKDLEKDVKTKIFTNWGGIKEISYPTNLKNLTKEEKIVNFFKALMYSHADPTSAQVLRALVEGTDSQGGYLVPEELRAEVFRVMPDYAVMRKLARIIPMSTDTLKLNSNTAVPTAYWTSEYQSKSTTSAEFGQVSLTPNDLVCLLPVSEQLLADANINLVQLIIELFAEAIARAEDKAFFTGSGSGQPKGISTESLNSINAGGTLDLDNVIDLIDTVPQSVTQSQTSSVAFVGNRYVKRLVRKLKDTTGEYLWRQGGVANNGQTVRLPDTLYGYPFYEQNDLPQSELYFGDWKNYIIGDRQVMTVKTTDTGGEAWRRNSVEIKAVSRVDGKAVLTSPFAKITNA